ncbi:hypothetical protein Sta7437_0165 [Stanieria cyanosphaera PCC 7437]|uniref:ABM domain-containing protein n=1 Tax=Stanieria cyanosphaera (strain ATCC 29371 / PCC 7437) TaxID=111780 RepID=K9XMQ5_STAC7|nr:TIGR03792 family protein [Stanieria cyanosphaera]AFZ33783.1 hypothetical protein Sta7437_0165 [Stanieria cyanosphaera PCC 7437]
MVIEWLKFQVAPESREKFIQKDEQIWTAFLTTCSGFLGKEIWLNPDASDQIVIVAHWQTREQWKAIPQKLLAQTEAKFAQQMGRDRYKMIEMAEYQIRKFPEMSKSK